MRRPSDPISTAALVYLAAPSFAFLLGWLEFPAGVTLAALLAAAGNRLVRQLPHRPFTHTPGAWTWLLAVAALWAAFSGAGHFVYANTDWRTRDTVYADLILTSWPPGYGLGDGVPLVLRTAMGYFLPPALLAKLMGIEFASGFLFAWTALGVALFLLLLPLPQRLCWRLVISCALVVFFSGMDWPAIGLIHGHLPMFPLPLEWWRPWTYTSLTGQLLWAPNHALAIWLGTSLFFRHRDDPALAALALVLLPILLLWTPFAVLGLLPWLLWGALRHYPSARAALGTAGAVQWLFALAFTAVLAGLFSRPGIAAGLALPDPAGSAAIARAGGIDLELFAGFVQFLAFEFGILALLLRPRDTESRQALALATVMLSLLPLIRFGPSDDWLLRVTTPSLLILMLLTLAEFNAPGREILRSPRHGVMVGVLLLGAITPLFEFSRAILWQRTPPNYGQSLVEGQQGFLPPHYLGKLDLAGLQVLLKALSPVPEAASRQMLLPPSMRHPP
jgi:hypothetical protein